MRPLDLLGIVVTATQAYGPIFSVHAGCERKVLSFGVSISKREEWLDEDFTGQKRWLGVVS